MFSVEHLIGDLVHEEFWPVFDPTSVLWSEIVGEDFRDPFPVVPDAGKSDNEESGDN
jgi:hypothetical protein